MKIILIIGLIILILGFCFVMWALCRAASIAEKIEEDIYRNYFGNENDENKDL
jgi:hypothetical protein